MSNLEDEVKAQKGLIFKVIVHVRTGVYNPTTYYFETIEEATKFAEEKGEIEIIQTTPFRHVIRLDAINRE